MSEVVKLNIKPTEVNPTIDACADTIFIFRIIDGGGSPVDISNYTAKMQVRPYPGAKKLYDELTTENSRLFVEGDSITIKFPAAVSSKYEFEMAVYDLYINSPSGDRYRVAQGGVQISREVTLL